MNLGRVYRWNPDSSHPLHGRVSKEIVPLPRLDSDGNGKGRLWGRFVRVRNAGAAYEQDRMTGSIRPVPLGDAQPDAAGDFLYEPGRGGCRIDKGELNPFQDRYIRAAHFGEVNAYYHIERIAFYIDELLRQLGARPLPVVWAVVNAHDGITEVETGRDGLHREQGWVPFQGGHYRLASRKYDILEHEPVSPDGEIHLGPGRQLVREGALSERSGKGYRASASHNAGILYHEYGHHITPHTADFRANCLRSPEDQNNRKTAMDEGTCDYWAAAMLGTPHIWAWHHRHDDEVVHPRSLCSRKTMADFDHTSGADPHLNGTIWGAGLWDFRVRLSERTSDGARQADRLLLQALLLLGTFMGDVTPPTVKAIREARKSFSAGLSALLQADELLYAKRHRDLIVATFATRGVILNCPGIKNGATRPGTHGKGLLELSWSELLESSSALRGLLKHVPLDDIPETQDLHSAESLEQYLSALREPPLSLVAVGDIMLGGRAKQSIAESGPDYPFRATLPILRRAAIGLGNLEGPLARVAERQDRNFSYRVNPRTARALLQAGINVATLANNHLLDCGREGVLETLDALASAGVAAVGAGVNEQAAHRPVILRAGSYRIGLLGYYWNRRTSARRKLPGSAMDPPEALAADIGALSKEVDRVVVSFHWGVPYVREPSPEDGAKARLAIDCGAAAVIGHHPHIVQRFEIYRGRPIFFSIGNFAFGSGNSRGESLLLALRFEEKSTFVYVYPVYVKNRDPRVNYQPKVLRGNAAERVLRQLTSISGVNAPLLKIEDGRGILELPWPGETAEQNPKTNA